MQLKSTPIRRKLMSMVMVTTTAALLLMVASFFVYELLTFRHAAVRQLTTQGEIVAANSTAALAFDNQSDAQEILSALRAERHIVSAGLYDKNGKLFSKYPAELPDSAFPKAPELDGYRFLEGDLVGFQRVVEGKNNRLGTLYLKSDMGAMTERFQLYGLIASLVIFVSLLLAYAISRVLQRQISSPILSLAGIANAVSERGDYSVRATKLSGDEVGMLTDSFNQMLARIQEQNHEREQAEAINRKNFELEEMNRQIQEANRLKSEFLANMSHELRTPLNGIIGFSEFLAEGKPGPLNEKQMEYLGDIRSSGRHLLHLINDVLDLAKVEAGKMEVHPEDFSLVKAIEEVRAVTRPLAQDKRINVTVDIAPELDQVTLDQQRFKQVLYNLLSNAIKFTDHDGAVSISATTVGRKFFKLWVTDSGIGIKPEDIARLFQEFEQLDSGSARKYQGTGLGLALSRKIVELQGGAIRVESTVGEGSTFTVVLPLVAGGVSSMKISRILVVDDNPTNLKLAADVLEMEGYDVLRAADGESAQEIVRATPPDLILMDLGLPGIDGLTLTRMLKADEQTKDIIVIAFTAFAMKGDEAKALEAGCDGYLSKPIDIQILCNKIAEYSSPAGEAGSGRAA